MIRGDYVPEKGFEIFTRKFENSLGFKVFSKKANREGESEKKHYQYPPQGNNPFSDRLRGETLYLLKGKIEARFFTKDNEYVGSQIISEGDTVLFNEIHQVAFLEDTVFVEVSQGPYPGTREKDKFEFSDSDEPLGEKTGEINQNQERTTTTFTKDGRLVGAIILGAHRPAQTQILNDTGDPIILTTLLHNKGQTEDNLDLRQKTLFLLDGKLKIFFYSESGEFIDSKVLNKADVVFVNQKYKIEYLEDSTVLEALAGSSPISDLGGIDLNRIDVERQGAGVDIQFDPVDVQMMIDMGITGFAPVIISITPLPSVLPLLGLAPKREEEEFELSKVN